MTRIGPRLILTVMLLVWTTAVPAQVDPDAEAAGRVVMLQLEAFRRGDFDAAFGFASAEIHEMFDRGRFETMVRGGYGSERGPGGRIYLLVRVRGANGRGIEAVYEMVREDRGWRINGVVTRPDDSERA